MTVQTKIKFYYNYVIDATNFYLNFSEGAGDIAAQLNPGRYSLTNLGNHIAEKMSEVGGQDYSVAIDRTTRKYTISAAGNFEILAATGLNIGLGAWSTLGFDATDLVGVNTYEAQNASGSEYVPQFRPQNDTSFDHWKEFAESNVNESGSGVVELYSLGQKNFMEMDIKYCTNTKQAYGAPIENNAQGVEDIVSFMDYAITKGDIEYMQDRDNVSSFETIILESTRANKKGTGYKLKENRNVVGFFDTGVIKFRKKI